MVCGQPSPAHLRPSLLRMRGSWRVGGGWAASSSRFTSYICYIAPTLWTVLWTIDTLLKCYRTSTKITLWNLHKSLRIIMPTGVALEYNRHFVILFLFLYILTSYSIGNFNKTSEFRYIVHCADLHLSGWRGRSVQCNVIALALMNGRWILLCANCGHYVC